MNGKTKESSKNFIQAIELMSQGVMLQTGVETCTQVIDAGEKLKMALDKDETLAEMN
jgi:hypothetical protein